MLGRDIFFAVFASSSNDDLAFGNVNRHIDWLGKVGSLLKMPVAQEPKTSTLCKDSGFVIDRAIFETEDQVRFNPVAADDLNEVSFCDRLSGITPQFEKTVLCPSRWRAATGSETALK